MQIQAKFIVYYVLMLFCCIAGAVNFNKKINLRPLFILLPISLSTELLVEYLIYKKINFYPVYHFYEILDFISFCLLFYINTENQKFRKLIKLLSLFYVSLIIFITIKYVHIKEFPSLQYSAESLFLSIISIVFLFNFPTDENNSIFRNSMFWICMGLILFHCGILLMNGSYNYLKSISPGHALFIKDWVNMGFNYLLYISLFIAIIWPKNTTK
jgi:hypothetical protein